MKLAEQIVDRFRALRARAVERLRETNKVSEQATLATGGHVRNVVDLARTHIVRLREVLSAFVGTEDSQLARAIRSQSDHVSEHSESISVAVAEHVKHVGAVAAEVRSMRLAAREIDRLNAAARMLSFNMRIEAARSSDGAVFRTIASEMQQLSSAIDRANKNIHSVAKAVELALPKLVAQGQELQSRVETYAVEAREQITRVNDRVRELQAAVASSIVESDSALTQIVSQSHGALSCLQSQDVCAQRLLQLDTWSAEYQQALADELGVVTVVAPVANPTLGGSDDSTHIEAGELIEF